MQKSDVFTASTEKSVTQFVKDFGQVAGKYGFIIHNADRMALADTFAAHGVGVSKGFDLHMIQLCKPAKAAKSLAANPERAVLMPKFIMVFTADGATQIRFLRFRREEIRDVVDDDLFPASLAETYGTIERIIEEAR